MPICWQNWFLLSIVDTSVAELVPSGQSGAPIGIIATRATLRQNFDAPLMRAGHARRRCLTTTCNQHALSHIHIYI